MSTFLSPHLNSPQNVSRSATRPRILVAEQCQLPAWLDQHAEVLHLPEAWKNEDLLRVLTASSDALVVRNHVEVSRRFLLNALPQLKVVARFGVGLDHIDTAAANDLGVKVVHAAGANARSVAEYCLAQILNLSRLIPNADHHVQGGGWNRFSFVGRELSELTVGIVGYGKAGAELAGILILLGAKVVVCARRPEAVPSFYETVDLDRLLTMSDVVSLHVAANSETRNIFGRIQFRMMKRGALLVNAGRGSLIDEDALLEALTSGHLGGAALDVRVQEPAIDNRFANLPNVLLSPHIASLTNAAEDRVGEDLGQKLLSALRETVSPNVMAWS